MWFGRFLKGGTTVEMKEDLMCESGSQADKES